MVMGCPDVVGFGGAGVYVSLNTGSGFSAMTQWVVAFGKGIGWTDNNTYPNMLIDVNGDSLPDVVGFAASGVYMGIDLDGNRTSRLGRTIAYTSYNKPSSITRHAHHLLPRRDRASALQADHAGKDHALHRRVRRSGRGQQSRHGLHALDRLSAKVGMRALRVASETLTTRYFITDYLGLVSVPSNLQFTCNVLIWIPASAPIFTSKLLKLRVKKETLNQRVPGSSPGAPTKSFKHLAEASYRIARISVKIADLFFFLVDGSACVCRTRSLIDLFKRASSSSRLSASFKLSGSYSRISCPKIRADCVNLELFARSGAF
jgi:hypothetical protein